MGLTFKILHELGLEYLQVYILPHDSAWPLGGHWERVFFFDSCCGQGPDWQAHQGEGSSSVLLTPRLLWHSLPKKAHWAPSLLSFTRHIKKEQFRWVLISLFCRMFYAALCPLTLPRVILAAFAIILVLYHCCTVVPMSSALNVFYCLEVFL